MTFRWIGAEEAGACIVRAAGADLDAILRELHAGGCAAFDVNGGQAVMVARVEDRELVVMCFEGEGLRSAAPAIVDIARQNGLHSIRFHTRRPGIEKMVRHLGFVEAERVYRMAV